VIPNDGYWHNSPIAQKAVTVSCKSNDNLPRSQTQRFTQYVKHRLAHKKFVLGERAFGRYWWHWAKSLI